MSTAEREHAALQIDGAPLEVVSLAGREGISQLFAYEVLCAASAEGPSPGSCVGAPAVITLFDGFGAERSIHGIVTEASLRVSDDRRAILAVTLRPGLYALSLGRDSRVFQDLTVPDIVRAVIAGAPALAQGIPTRWELKSTYPTHVYCVEHREDDLSFISRLLEEEGIYTWFDHQGGRSVLVFADDSTRAPDLAGGARVPFAMEIGTTRDAESIVDLGPTCAVAPTRFTVGSFNPQNPRLAVTGAAGRGDLEIYRAEGGGPETPDACARAAGFAAEAAAAGAEGATGKSTSVRLVPGMIVEVDGHPIADLDGRYLVVETSVQVVQRRRGPVAGYAAEDPYLCRFRLLREDVRFRPARQTRPGRQAGLQIGRVVGPAGAEIYPSGAGAVRVQYHWDRLGNNDERAGKWMRVAQRGTADSMLLPRVGWNVATFNEEGEIDAPYVLSRFHDAEHPPDYPLPENKTRVVFKTATSPGGGSFNEVRFEDKAGSEEMFLNASKDMTSLVKNDLTTTVSHDRSRTVEHDHTFTVGNDYEDVVEHDQTVLIGEDEAVKVGGSSEKTVTGSEINTISGGRTLQVGAEHRDQVGKHRKLEVGSAQIDVTLGYVQSIAKHTSILVGGAMIRATMASLLESGGWISVQTIGGARLELLAKNRVTDVKGLSVETVGGAMMITAASSFIDAASTVSAWTVAGALNTAAPSIVVEATAQIQLTVGGTTLTITPEEVTISASKLDLSEASAAVVNTGKAKHN